MQRKTVEEIRKIYEEDGAVIVCMPVADAIIVSKGSKVFECCICSKEIYAAVSSQCVNSEIGVPYVCLPCALKMYNGAEA